VAMTENPDPEVRDRYDVARTLMAQASDLAGRYFEQVSTLEVHSKGLQDVVTEADLQVELLLKNGLAQAFPADAFFGEETGSSEVEGAEGIWVVDPIDGTQPFVSGMTGWCVSLAYVHRGVLQFGVVVNPALAEEFAGGRGIPATLNGRPIAVHPGTSLTAGITSVGYSPRIGVDDILPVLDRLLRSGGTFFRNGSGALTLCYVAAGRLLGYVEPHINSYDCLGGIAIVEAAGGRVNDYLVGDAMWVGNRIVAGPPAVYDELDRVCGPAVIHRSPDQTVGSPGGPSSSRHDGVDDPGPATG
jgi:myo-inositol-1(or 4)-monophosphatase